MDSAEWVISQNLNESFDDFTIFAPYLRLVLLTKLLGIALKILHSPGKLKLKACVRYFYQIFI